MGSAKLVTQEGGGVAVGVYAIAVRVKVGVIVGVIVGCEVGEVV
jgi:hypothetical protein